MPSRFPQVLLDAIPAALVIADPATGQLLAANAAFARSMEISDDQLPGVALVDLLAPEDRTVIVEALGRLTPSGTVEFTRVRPRNSADSVLELQLRYVDASPAFVVGVARDVPGAGTALGADAGMSEALLRAIPDSIYRIDSKGLIVDYKPAASTRGQLSAEPVELGMSIHALATSETDQQALRDAVHRAVSSGELQRVEYESDRGGEDRIYEARFVAEGTGRVVAIVRDLTESKQSIANLARTERFEALGLLAGGIAHDFNNLVAGSFGHVEMAREYIIEDKATRAVDCLNEAARAFGRARDLTRQLMTFSKGGTPQKVPGNLPSVVKRAAEAALTGPNVTLRVHEPPQTPSVPFDESQMTQVIGNLVVNACHAMPQGGSLDISFSLAEIAVGSSLPLPVGTYARVSIKDSGTGIPLENMPKLFDPFFTTKPNGTGLGLAATYSIVKRHGGHLDVQSELGSGTVCHVYLPLETETRAEPGKLVSARPTRQGRVLVMDDEDAVRRVTSSFLMRLGYEVSLAVDGGEAIEIYRRTLRDGQKFAFIILDLTVPGGLGGRETLESIRKIDAGVTAIATSGYSNDPILSNPESYGFRAGLAKPYSRQEFLNLIGRVTGA